MYSIKQYEFLFKIGQWIYPRLKKYEVIIGSLIAIVLILQTLSNLETSFFMTLFIIILADLYFFSAFTKTYNDIQDKLKVLFYRVLFISLCLVLIGILYKLRYWPGSEPILIVGLSTLLISLLGVLLSKTKDKSNSERIDIRIFIRSIMVGAIGLTTYLAPTDYLISIGLMK